MRRWSDDSGRGLTGLGLIGKAPLDGIALFWLIALAVALTLATVSGYRHFQVAAELREVTRSLNAERQRMQSALTQRQALVDSRTRWGGRISETETAGIDAMQLLVDQWVTWLEENVDEGAIDELRYAIDPATKPVPAGAGGGAQWRQAWTLSAIAASESPLARLLARLQHQAPGMNRAEQCRFSRLTATRQVRMECEGTLYVLADDK